MPDTRARSRRAERARRAQRRLRARVLVGFLTAALILAVVGGAAILASGSDDDGVTIAELRLVDFGIIGDLEVPAGEVRLSAVNEGDQPHNVGIRGGPISNEVGPGGSIELDIGTLEPGTYELYCDLTGHEDLGMTAPFVVTTP